MTCHTLIHISNIHPAYTQAQSSSCIEPSLAFATRTTSKHQRITWPGLYRKLIDCLCIVLWQMRVSTRLLEVTWLDCDQTYRGKVLVANKAITKKYQWWENYSPWWQGYWAVELHCRKAHWSWWYNFPSVRLICRWLILLTCSNIHAFCLSFCKSFTF